MTNCTKCTLEIPDEHEVTLVVVGTGRRPFCAGCTIAILLGLVPQANACDTCDAALPRNQMRFYVVQTLQQQTQAVRVYASTSCLLEGATLIDAECAPPASVH